MQRGQKRNRSGAGESKRRVEAALAKAERGEELTEKELFIVVWETSLGSCHACSPRVRVFHPGEKRARSEGGDR